MRKALLSILIIAILIMPIGCSNPIQIPDGIDNEQFFMDMIQCLDLTKKATKTKNDKYIEDIDSILELHSDSNHKSQDITLNKKENDILFYITLVRVALEDYINIHPKSNSGMVIADSTVEGEILLEYIQMTIDEMGIEYKFN